LVLSLAAQPGLAADKEFKLGEIYALSGSGSWYGNTMKRGSMDPGDSRKSTMQNTRAIVPVERIERMILLIRHQKVMLDRDLAQLYGVETRALNQAVRRNAARFPDDFMFRLNDAEAEWLVSQNVIPHRKYLGGALPMAFTEQGVAMLSSVLNSTRAIQVNITIMRAFVQLRAILSTHADLARKLEELEKKYDAQFRVVFDAIRQLMEPSPEPPPEPPRERIGFRVRETSPRYGAKRRRRG
ncbi:MAG: ORF6N domain-containing protein, partial [Planctomycetota bacterium]|nr:ORF6N domain-containing protein [Planctomycetota bacterium]